MERQLYKNFPVRGLLSFLGVFSFLIAALTFEAAAAANLCEKAVAELAQSTHGVEHDTEFQELLRPVYQTDVQRGIIDLNWSRIAQEVKSRMNLSEVKVDLLIDGVSEKGLAEGETTHQLRFKELGEQHDVVIQFRDPRTNKVVHETYPVLLESTKSQMAHPESFQRRAVEAPLSLSFPQSFRQKSKINDGLVKRTVELGYEKVVWTLTEKASVETRQAAERYGHNLQVIARLDASGQPKFYELRTPGGQSLGKARAEEIRLQNDAAFNGHAFLWDNEFVSLASAIHHPYLTASTMNFHYSTQMKNGVIPREVRHKNGVSYHRYEEIHFGERRQNDEFINPNFTGWVELHLHSLAKPSTSKPRLQKAITSMERYAQWVEKNRSVRDADGELIGFWTSNLGSGADNAPRGGGNLNKQNFHKAGWVDLLAQQIMLYKDMAEMHAVLGEWASATAKNKQATALQELLNRRYWNAELGFYFDLVPGKSGQGLVQDTATPTQSSFWAYVAAGAKAGQVQATVDQQLTPDKFGGPFPGASLASSHPEFVEHGGYWRGGRWPPTGVIMTQGFENSGRWDVAYRIARDFWVSMSEVSRQHKEQTGKDSVFEFYGVETQPDGSTKPIVGRQTGHQTRADFTGWGKTPITYSGIRNVFGLRPVGAYLGAKQSAERWLQHLIEAGENSSNSAGGNSLRHFSHLLKDPAQKQKVLEGYIEWHLNFDFKTGESLRLDNFVYQGIPVHRLELIKTGENTYRLEVDSDQPFHLQVLRRFANTGDSAPKSGAPTSVSQILTVGGAHKLLELNLN